MRRAQPSEPSGLSELISERRYGIADLFEMRIGLEGLAVSLAALRATEGEIEDIAKLNRQHLDAGNDQEELLRTDQAFHEAIVMAARNELLLETYQQLVPEIVEWRFDSFAVRGVPLRSGREHEKVVRYLRNNDPGGARVAMNGHLQRLYDELAEIRYEPLDLTQSRPDEEPEWHTRDIHR